MKCMMLSLLAASFASLATASVLRTPLHPADFNALTSQFLGVLGTLRGVPSLPQSQLAAERRAELEEYALQVLSVQRQYELAWACGIGILSILTLAYIGLKEMTKGNTNEKDEATRRMGLQKKATGISTEDTEFAMTQTGFVQCPMGTPLYFTWALVPFLGYVQMTVFTVDHYLFALHVPDQTWLQLAEPFLLVFVISHAVLFLQVYVGARARVFFMSPASISEATRVLMSNPENAEDPGTLLEVKWTDKPLQTGSGGAKDEGSEKDKEPMSLESTRYFEFTCVRYLWNDKACRFRPSGHDDATCEEAKQRLMKGGHSTAEVLRRAPMGPNTINIEVPSLLMSLANEFMSAIYIFQFSCIWVYMFYSTWNIATIWLVLALFSGSTKAYLVRRNKLKIKEMAATVTEASVYRAGAWVKVSSAEVVPGDILCVTDGTVPCDIAILEGCAVVNESMLTGEPMPVQRFPIDGENPQAKVEATGHMKRHFLLAGTEVLQSTAGSDSTLAAPGGQAVGIAACTGARTSKGSLVRMVLFPAPIRFEFTDQLPSVYMIMVGYVVVLFLLQLLKDQGHWIVAVFTGLCLLTQSLQPNMPVSFTLAQNVAAQRLKSELGVLCLSPERTPIAGKVHVMVLDKTGTITKDGMDFAGVYPASPTGGEFQGFHEYEAGKTDEFVKAIPTEMLWVITACHTVSKMNDGRLIGNAVEIAMLEASGWELSQDGSSVRQAGGDREIKLIKPLEFDHPRFTSGAVIGVDGKTFVLMKGSYERVEQLISKSTPVPADYKKLTEKCASDQYYTLSVGIKELPGGYKPEMTRDEYEEDLKLLGLVLFRNELKPDSPQALQELRDGGIRCVICTGDNVLTGEAIGRRCNMLGQEGMKVVMGDGDGASVSWTSLPDGQPLAHDEVMDMDATEVDIVLSRPAFKFLTATGDIDELIEKVRVYARMKPEDKVAVIENHQARGWVVGMAGDGGNDCGALRAAHVGLALSEAEASIVAPFSSGAEYGTGFKSLRAMPDIIRYGRAALATNLATYMYFMVYALCVPIAKFALLFLGNMAVSEWAWLFLDIAVGSFMIAFMTFAQPSDKLAPMRPTSKLFGYRTTLTVLMPVFVFGAFMTTALMLLWQQDFYIPYDSIKLGVPGHEWQKKGDNFDTSVVFFFLALQLPTVAFAFSFGAEHRKPVFTNVAVVVTYVLVVVGFFVLLWGGPSDFHCVFRVNCDSHTSESMYVPGVQEISTGNLGGCFLGPHLLEYKEKHGGEYEIPTKENGCNPHPSVDISEEIQARSDSISWLGHATCRGPHNCFDFHFRAVMSVLLTLMVLCTFGVSKVASLLHPAPKDHFKRL